jgi:hypothetical protein
MTRDRSKRQFRVLSPLRGAPTNEQARRSRRLFEVLQPGGGRTRAIYEIPDCFDCGGTKSAFQFTEMQLELSGFGWDLTTGSWCSSAVDYYSYDYGTSPPTITYVGTVNADLQLTVPALSALNTTITLQEKPVWYNTSPFYGGGLMSPTPASVNAGCHWLWNHVKAVHATGYRMHWSVTGSGAVDVDYPQVLDQYEYEPLTPAGVDATSMWGREYDYTDSRCGTTTPSGMTTWRCSDHVYGFTVRMGTLTNPTSWPAGKYWWVSIVGFPLLFTYTDATGTAPNGVRPVSPNAGPFGNCMGACGPLPFVGYVPDPATGAGQPEYCFRQSSQLPGRMDLEYIKIIDCENDFTGDPLTLELYKEGASNSLAGVTQPDTITLVPVMP